MVTNALLEYEKIIDIFHSFLILKRFPLLFNILHLYTLAVTLYCYLALIEQHYLHFYKVTVQCYIIIWTDTDKKLILNTSIRSEYVNVVIKKLWRQSGFSLEHDWNVSPTYLLSYMYSKSLIGLRWRRI